MLENPRRTAKNTVGSKRFGNLVAGALTCIAVFSGAPTDAKAPALKTTLAPERSLILKGDTRTVYVLIRFAAPELDIAPTKRPPLNLSLVLDRSGSMSDAGKMEYLKTAAKMAVSRLGNRDAVSVVEFDDRITTMWKASRASEKDALAAMIDSLSPRGSTNLAGGLQAGIAEAKGATGKLQMPRDTLSRVILLSDGLANTGITDHGAIARMAAAGRNQGVRVSAIGLGRDYDEDLMQAVAESGGGKYYYVEGPAQLARIFEEELKSAFATRARDVHLGFKGSPAVRKAEFVGFSDSTGPNASADWPDFYAGEKRTVLLRLEISARDTGALELGHFTAAWRDAESGASGTLDLPVRIGVTEDVARADGSIDRDVAVETSLAESERELAGNVKLYEAGRTDEARTNNAAVIQRLKDKNSVLKDERLARKIEAMNVEQDQMASAAAAPAQRAGYLKATKQRLYQAKSGKRDLYVLQKGDHGLEVEQLQRALQGSGYYKGKITGTYDQPTADAVKAYQSAKGIPSDGVAGANTQQALGLY